MIHGSTPFSLMFGQKLNSFQDYNQIDSKPLPYSQLKKWVEYLSTVVFPAILIHSKTNQEKMINRFNRKMFMKDILFPDGSYVMIIDKTRKSKLDPIYEGPFKVIHWNHGGSYILQDNDGTLLSRNYPPSALKLISQDPITSGQSYEVQAILDHKGEGSNHKYLVRWKNFDKSYDSWESVRNFNDHDVIDQYWKHHKEK